MRTTLVALAALLTAAPAFAAHPSSVTRSPVVAGAAAAIYVASTDLFTCNKHLQGQTTIFDHGADGEPAVAVDDDGNTWITGIAGVGGGIGLWKIAPTDVCAQSPIYLDNPDAGVGGGDTDVAVATQRNQLGFYNIYTSSLTLANVTSSTSVDGGNTFVMTPISNEQAAEDRQWNAAYGVNTIYLSYNIGATQPGQVLELYRSSAAGVGGTFAGPFLPRGASPPTVTYGMGNLATDRRAGGDEALLTAGPDGEGNVYQGYHQNGGTEVWVAVSRNFGTTWSQSKVYQAPGGVTVAHKFTWIAVDGAGNVYTCWSDDHDIYYSVSKNFKTTNAATWSAPVRLSNGAETRTSIFPAMEAGSDGRIAFAWYGTDAPTAGSPGSLWHYFHARCNNATSANPVIEQVRVSDHVVHSGPVCEAGLSCGCCRQLLECQEMAINPVDGSSIVTYGSFGVAGIYVTHEVKGASAIAGKTIVDRSLNCPLPPTCIPLDPLAESPCILPGRTLVTDPADLPPVANPQQDIQSLSIAEPYGSPIAGGNVIVFTMKVASLNPNGLPPNAFWRIIFTGPLGPQYVSMVNCAVGGVRYEFGHFNPSAVYDGPPDVGEFFPDGTIRITLDRARIGNPAPSSVISAISGDTRDIAGNCPATTAVFAPIDTTVLRTYTVVGNTYCTPPTATCPPSFTDIPGPYARSFIVNNPSTASRTYRVSISDPLGWLSSPVSNVLFGPVSPASSGALPVTIQIPGPCNTSVSDALQWTVTAADLPSPTNVATCQTTVTCQSAVAVGEGAAGPLAFSLMGSNPFHGRARMSYTLPERLPVRIEVFGVTGQRVRTLVDQVQEAGNYTAAFSIGEAGSSRRLGAGVYLIRITAGERSQSLRVVALD